MSYYYDRDEGCVVVKRFGGFREGEEGRKKKIRKVRKRKVNTLICDYFLISLNTLTLFKQYKNSLKIKYKNKH